MQKRTVFILLAAFTLMACVGTSNLRSKRISLDTRPAGRFDLILYTSLEDEILLKIAVLDNTKDDYKLVPNAARFNFKTFKGLEANVALKKAVEFLSDVEGYSRMELREIKGPEGGVVAIEARPLYDTFLHGTPDIIDTTYYVPKEGTIKFIVRSTLIKPMLLRGLKHKGPRNK